MRVFCKAQQFTGVNIDEDLVCESVRWLIENQSGNGALPEVYRVIHGEMVVSKGTYELILVLPVIFLNELYLSFFYLIYCTSDHNIVVFASFCQSFFHKPKPGSSSISEANFTNDLEVIFTQNDCPGTILKQKKKKKKLHCPDEQIVCFRINTYYCVFFLGGCIH